MKRSDIHNEIKRLPAKKYSMLVNFLRWLSYSDDVLTDKEIKEVLKSRKEKGGTPWEQLRQNV